MPIKMQLDQSTNKLLRHLAVTSLLLALFIILWGAWVRISHSGDGCGASWPLCDGQLVPYNNRSTLIEFTHRLTSGAFGLLVLALWFLVRRAHPKRSATRAAATALLLLTGLEALLGAKLVLFGLVGSDTSIARVVVAALHLTNTLLLLASNVALSAFLTQPSAELTSLRWSQIKRVIPPLLGVILIAITGVFAALASTLFPDQTLLEGFKADLSSDSHIVTRLRVLHPIAATLVTLYLVNWVTSLPATLPGLAGKLQRYFVFALFGALAFGVDTLLLRAPVWMKLTHLLWADLLWCGLVLLAIRSSQQVQTRQS